MVCLRHLSDGLDDQLGLVQVDPVSSFGGKHLLSVLGTGRDGRVFIETDRRLV